MYAARSSALRGPCLGQSRASCWSAVRPAGVQRRSVAPKALLELHQAAAAATTSGATLLAAHHTAMQLVSLAEGPAAVITGAVASGATAVADSANAAAGATGTAVAAASGGGPFDILAHAFESFLTVLDVQLEHLGVPYSYGWAIILLTVLVKLGTFPLSQKQVQSTQALQALQPQVKELQAKYAGEQETIQLETARLYREAGVNPLAGCLPTLATIPVFIGLYRALTMAADDGLLNQGFFWIPSLAGPTSMASRVAGSGFSWLFPLVDGAPPIGWHDALAYLVMPVALVLSQALSMKVMAAPASSDPQAQQTNAILKFLPLLIGYFSLNVPSGLTLYWFVNNLLSTAQQLYLKQAAAKPAMAAVNASMATMDVTASTVVSPKEERVKTRLSGQEGGSRRNEAIDVSSSSMSSSNGASQASQGKASAGSKGGKFRALKAREASAKAATSAQSNGTSSSVAAADRESAETRE